MYILNAMGQLLSKLRRNENNMDIELYQIYLIKFNKTYIIKFHLMIVRSILLINDKAIVRRLVLNYF